MNKYTTPANDIILKHRLSVLVDKVRAHSKPDGSAKNQTVEAVLQELTSIIHDLYKKPQEPTMRVPHLLPGTEPSPEDLNTPLESAYDDLLAIYRAFDNAESLVVGAFNYQTSILNKLSADVREVSSLLGDLSLYGPNDGSSYDVVGDSFKSLDKTDYKSTLIASKQTQVNIQEGIVTLPPNSQGIKVLKITADPVINPGSDGNPGNTQEKGRALNADPKAMLDGNPDTWFEYEKVLDGTDEKGLVFDFTLRLQKAEVINFIRINPNNFGAKTPPVVEDIMLSADGRKFESIKKDILSDDIFDTGDEVFKLTPSTSKYSGQGFYSFSPRKTLLVRVVIAQKSPYPIVTTDGKKRNRYAVGIRDVQIESRKFSTKGEFISKAYSFSSPVRKVMLTTTQAPPHDAGKTGKAHGSISHFISLDNGTSWTSISPMSGTSGNELIDINGVSPKTLKTSTPNPTTLRYKAILERNDSTFSSSASTQPTKELPTTEMHQAPSDTPFSMTLEHSPIQGSVIVTEPYFGSRGLEKYKYRAAIGTGGKLKIQIPWKISEFDPVKVKSGSVWYTDGESPIEVYVDGVLWSRGKLSAATSTDNVYQLDHYNGYIETGDGTHGRAVPSGAVVELLLKEERLYPSADSRHECSFRYPFTPNAKDIEIWQVEPLKSVVRTLPAAKKNFKVDPLMEETPKPVFSDQTVFKSEKPFIDGSVELSAAGHYSIDYRNGRIYSYSRTTGTTTVKYTYEPRRKVDDFDITPNGVSLSHGTLVAHGPSSPLSVPSGVRTFSLAHLAIVPGTLKFSGNISGVFDKEVPFDDGRTELLDVVLTKYKIPSITVSSETNVTISLPLKISPSTDMEVNFTDTDTFATEVSVTPTSVGEYQIDRANSQVIVRVSSSVSDPGYVSYFYEEYNLTKSGYYSVDYEKGEIYTHDVTPSGVTVDYKYSHYIARYPVSRIVDKSLVTVSGKKVTLSDSEVLEHESSPRTVSSARPYYRIYYKYAWSPTADLAELKEYYTPILREYSLRVVTEDKLY